MLFMLLNILPYFLLQNFFSYPYSGTVFNHKRNEVLIDAAVWINSVKIMVTERSQTQKTTLCDSIYWQCPGQTNPLGQKVDSWLSRAGGGNGGTGW